MASSTSRWVIAPVVSTAPVSAGPVSTRLRSGSETDGGTDWFLTREITVD